MSIKEPMRISDKLDRFINRINIMQIVCNDKAMIGDMRKHIKHLQIFYKSACPWLTDEDLDVLKGLLLDFYSLIGIYRIGFGFSIRELDDIKNIEWVTLREFQILVGTPAFIRPFNDQYSSISRIIKANYYILKHFYSKHSHTIISIPELKMEIKFIFGTKH